jgi:uncharacterized protein
MNNWNPFARYPASSLMLLVVVLIPLLLPLRDLQVRSDADALLESNPSQKATLEKVTSVFQDQVILIVDLECPDVFTEAGIGAVGRVSDALMSVGGVLDVKSLTHSYKPIRKGFSFDMVPLVPRDVVDPVELERLREYCIGNPLIRNVMVSPDSQHATLVLTFDRQFETLDVKRQLRADIEGVFSEFYSEGLQFEVIGLPLVEEEVYSTIVGDLQRFLPVVVLFLIVTLGVAFRSIGFVVLMLVNQAMALVFIAGSLQWFGYPFTVFTLLLFPLWAGIHLTLLVHLGTACQSAANKSTEGIVSSAVSHIRKSCGFASLTTLAGLLSLGMAAIPQVREAGLIGAYGVGVVFLMTFGPGVAMMTLFYRWTRGSNNGSGSQSASDAAGYRSLAWVASLQRMRGLIALGIALIVLAIGVFGPRIRTGVRPIEFLPVDSPSRSAGERFNGSYGGFNMFQLKVDSGAANGVNQMPFLRYLEDVQTFAESKKGVSGAYSYAQVLAMMNQIWEQEKPGSLALPSNPLLLGTFSLVLKTQKFPFFEALCDADYRSANLVIRSPDLPSDQYLAIIKEIVEYAELKRPEGVSLSAEQGLHTILEADQQLVGSQLRSAGLALVVILVLLFILWRSPWLALISIGVNVIPVGTVLVAAYWLDVPLNSITVMIAAVAFGISIDDTVHFVTQWLDGKNEGLKTQEAIARAIQIKARPMIYSSLVLGGIFSLLMVTSFPPVQHFGGLSSLAFALALGSVFVLLPVSLGVKSSE